ncbi:MAG TPA: hypothetical protein VM030_10010 [Acidimicrobiales bacterium]|nr:hypothetical protein [Acidimicrobiales bacterium]
MRRPLRLAALVALLGVVLAPAPPSQATKREPMKITEGKTVEATFPALVGSVPQSEEQVRPNPSDCATYTWCDTVPLDIVPPPGLKDEDDFFVEVKISWDNPSGQNDIDTFAYDDQQTKGGAGYTQKASGASADNPETLRLFRPTLGTYNAVILNFVGPNTGYKVTARLLDSKYQAPFEALAPGKKPATTTTSTTRPVEVTAPPDTAPTETTPPTLAPAAVSNDDDFDFGTSDFEDQLAAPPRPEGGFEGESAAPANQVKKVGGGTVAIWFVVAPLILLGAAGYFIVHRRGGVAGF